MKKILLLITLHLIACQLIAQPFNITSYDVQIKVNKDASFDVTETINVNFNEKRRGIFRDIPYRYMVDGEERKVNIQQVNIAGFKHKTTRKNGNVNIRIGDANKYLTGPQRYVIQYQVEGAFHWLDTHTEFYWNLIGKDWEVPIPEVGYAVDFPDELSLTENDYRLFTSGGVNEKGVKHSDHTIYGKTLSTLEPGEPLTIAVKLPLDLIVKPVPPAPIPLRKELLAIPAMLLAFLSGLWYRIGRRETVAPAEIEQLYPPDDYSPAVLGLLHDNTVHNRDVIALLPWWASQGYIKMASIGSKGVSGLNLRLEKIKNLPEDAPKSQRYFYDSIFKENDLVFLSDFNNVFYSDMTATKKLVKSDFKLMGLYDKKSRNIFHKGLMILVGILCIALAIVFFAAFQQVIAGFSLIVVGIIAFVFHFLNPKLSEEARYLKSQLLRFHQFLKNPNSDKVAALIKEDALYFEKMFPYAVAFGFDQQWVKQFDNLTAAPTWYDYDDGVYNNNNTFSNTTPTFQQFSESFQPQEIAQVFTSYPVPEGGSSSGGSGHSSGGGFSGGSAGGGFGGGGGGSW